MRPGKLAISVAVAVAIGSAPRDASACSSPATTPLEVVAGGGGAAPGGVGEVTYTVNRGQGPRGSCTRRMTTSCDDSGTITLHFSPAADTDTASDQVGYELELVRGDNPGGPLPSGPVLAFFEQGNDGEATLWLHWDDGATDDQESIDFSITVTAVDAQGNRGPTSEPIRIRHDGGGGGCALRAANGARGISGAAGVLLLIVAALVRRSRGRGA